MLSGLNLKNVELADTRNLPCIINDEILHAVSCNFSHSFDASMGKKSFLELTSCTHVVAFVYVDPYIDCVSSRRGWGLGRRLSSRLVNGITYLFRP